MSKQSVIVNNTQHPIAVARRRVVGTAAPLMLPEALRSLLARLPAEDARTLEAVIAPGDLGRGQPEFSVEIVTLKPGANALDADAYELVMEQRKANPHLGARFDRRIKAFGNIVTLNIGRYELEDATHLDRATIQQAILQCSDPDSLRRFRQAFGNEPSMREIIENQLAATTVTDAGVPVADDVKRDPRNPRRSAA